MNKITKEQTKYIYEFGLESWKGSIKPREASEKLFLIHEVNKSTAQMFINNLALMLNGRVYKRAMSQFMADYFLDRIGSQFDPESKRDALRSVALHIQYWEGKFGRTYKSMRKVLNNHLLSEDYDTVNMVDFDSDFDRNVEKSQKLNETERKKQKKEFPVFPTKIEVRTKQFIRNPHVVTEVLKRANGVCEWCDKSAPFNKKKRDQPYLETHHKTPLAEGGADTTENAMALCPNCHREAHFGVHWERFRV